jgi:DME family drug/metabolite transporter
VLDNAFKRHSNYEEMRIGLNQEHKTLGALAVGAGAVLWGTIGPVISLFPDGVSFQYSAFRSAVGSLILWLIVGFSRNKTRYTREDIKPILIAGLGSGGFLPFFAMGFERTGVAVASVIAIGLAPIFVGIISWLLYKKSPGRTWAIGTALGIAGITALNWPGSDAVVNLAGITFAALAAFSYSWQAIGMSQLSKRHSPFQTVAPAFTVASLIQVPLTFGKSYEFLTDPLLLVGAIYGAIATLALAYSLFAFGVHRIGPANAVTVGLMEPITAAALGVTILNEKITSLGFLGIALVLIGLFIVGRPVKTG